MRKLCVTKKQAMVPDLVDQQGDLTTSQANVSKECFHQQLTTVLMAFKQGQETISTSNKRGTKAIDLESLDIR